MDDELDYMCWVCESYTPCPECKEQLERQEELRRQFEEECG